VKRGGRKGSWGSLAGGVRVVGGFSGLQHAAALPWQWASAVDEAHAALRAEASRVRPGEAMGPEARPAPHLRQESAVSLYSRNERPVATSGERPERRFEHWEPLEGLLTSLAEPPAGRLTDDLLDPHDALFTQIGR
jgi:hypothetical protein